MLCGVTTNTFDAANRLTQHETNDGVGLRLRAYIYTYTWSQRGQLLVEWTQGYPVRTFTYDGAGQMIAATLFTQTTRFTYNGLGARVAVEVVGYGTTTVTLDLAAGNSGEIKGIRGVSPLLPEGYDWRELR